MSYYKGNDGLNTSSIFNKTPDEISYIEESYLNQNWGNSIVALHFDSRVGGKSFSKITFYQSKWENENYRFKRFATDSASVVNDIYNADYKYSNFKTNGIRWEFDHQLNRKNMLRFGINLINYDFQPKFQTVSNQSKKNIYPEILTISNLTDSIVFNNYKSTEAIAFVEEELTFGNVVLNFGVHGSMYKYDTTSRMSIQPRLSLQVNGEKSWFNIGASSLRQYQQVISESNLGFPSDFWVNTTSHINPADALSASANFGFLATHNLSFNVGAYYKKMKNIISLSEGSSLIPDNSSSWQQLLDRGEGKAYGIEVTTRYNTDKINFENNFTIGNSTRQFQESNNGQVYNYKYNRRFMSNTTLNLRLSKRTEMTSVFTYQKGSYVSFPSGGVIVREVDGETIIYPEFKGKHNQTFDNYVRLDLGITFVSNNKIGTHKVFAGVYNVLNRKNPIYLELERNTFEPNVLEVSKVSIFPILPSLSYSLIFGKRKN